MDFIKCTYVGGHPESNRKFKCSIVTSGNKIVFQKNSEPQFSLLFEDITGIKIKGYKIFIEFNCEGSRSMLTLKCFKSIALYSQLTYAISEKSNITFEKISLEDIKKENNKKTILLVAGIVVFLAIAMPIAAHFNNQDKQTLSLNKKSEAKKETVKSNSSKKDNSIINEIKKKAKMDAVEDTKYREAMSSGIKQLGNDMQNELNDLTNQKIDNLKQDGIKVTNDCNNIENLKPTDTFYSIHEQLKEVCETYKNVYSNLYDKIQNGDTDWINQQKDVLSKANQETEDITKQIEAVTGK